MAVEGREGVGDEQSGSDLDGEATTTPAEAFEALAPSAPMLARTPFFAIEVSLLMKSLRLDCLLKTGKW
jgi:hypothetical protein